MTLPARPIRLYRYALSGHSHRVELFMSLLGLPFELVEVDMAKGAHKAPDFLVKNPLGQLPVVEDGDLTLPDSNAILVYLATRYDASGRRYPREPAAAARVQQWLSISAGQLAYGPIAARLYAVVEPHLATRRFLAGDEATIADVAMYAYTAHAPEGGVSLEPYRNVRAWLARIEALPGFVPMKRTPLQRVA
jgi:glutathione S-transferase